MKKHSKIPSNAIASSTTLLGGIGAVFAVPSIALAHASNSTSHAHDNAFFSGLAHVISGPDHIAVLFTLTLLAVVLSVKKQPQIRRNFKLSLQHVSPFIGASLIALFLSATLNLTAVAVAGGALLTLTVVRFFQKANYLPLGIAALGYAQGAVHGSELLGLAHALGFTAGYGLAILCICVLVIVSLLALEKVVAALTLRSEHEH